jgi:hypothetical protein
VVAKGVGGGTVESGAGVGAEAVGGGIVVSGSAKTGGGTPPAIAAMEARACIFLVLRPTEGLGMGRKEKMWGGGRSSGIEYMEGVQIPECLA